MHQGTDLVRGRVSGSVHAPPQQWLGWVWQPLPLPLSQPSSLQLLLHLGHHHGSLQVDAMRCTQGMCSAANCTSP
jgi:hypothetical protein